MHTPCLSLGHMDVPRTISETDAGSGATGAADLRRKLSEATRHRLWRTRDTQHCAARRECWAASLQQLAPPIETSTGGAISEGSSYPSVQR